MLCLSSSLHLIDLPTALLVEEDVENWVTINSKKRKKNTRNKTIHEIKKEEQPSFHLPIIEEIKKTEVSHAVNFFNVLPSDTISIILSNLRTPLEILSASLVLYT